MTREEEIRQAQVAIYGTEHCRAAEHFEQGASWADKTMLDRACEWLEKELKNYITVQPYSTFASIDMDALLEDLKKAIQWKQMN